MRVRKDLVALRTSRPLWFTKTQQRSIRGTPDFLLCVNGMFVALELKKDSKEKADPLQDHNLKGINRAKGIGLVVSPENWKKVFKTIAVLAKEKK